MKATRWACVCLFKGVSLTSTAHPRRKGRGYILFISFYANYRRTLVLPSSIDQQALRHDDDENIDYFSLFNFCCCSPGPQGRRKIIILGAGVAGITAAKTIHDKGITDFVVLEVIYQTRERVFHQDIQTPRSGLKKRGAAEFF